MSLAAAVVTRWNNAALNSSIAVLYRANPGLDEFGAMPEDLGTKDLPRAEFFLEEDTPNSHTVAYRIRRAFLTFRVYHSNDHTLESLLTSIEDNFDNAENAGSNPFSLSSSFGEVICVQYRGPREIHPVDEGIFLGTVTFSVDWQKAKVTPN